MRKLSPQCKLNLNGISKLVPFLQDIAIAIDNPLDIVISDGYIRVDSPHPVALIEEAQKDGVTLICSKIDDKNTYFEAYVVDEGVMPSTGEIDPGDIADAPKDPRGMRKPRGSSGSAVSQFKTHETKIEQLGTEGETDIHRIGAKHRERSETAADKEKDREERMAKIKDEIFADLIKRWEEYIKSKK